MIVAAVYARKSTEQGVPDEAKSTRRQITRATEYATARGWSVDPRHVYVDEAVSGGEWQSRPGFNALLAALRPKPPFGVLIVSELSRIGRDSVRVPYAVQQIEDAGVEIHGYLSGQRISVSDELGEMQTMLHSLAASYERRRARARTFDALSLRAKSGHVTGGTVYGYRNVRVEGHVERRIDEREAAVVRRIFIDYAAGIGLKALAATLTREVAPVPTPRRRDRLPGWSPSALHAMLGRELYIGIASWGARKKTDVGGRTKVRRWRPETERIRVEVPGLRIVDETCWQAVQARRTASARQAGTITRGAATPALLAGLARCGLCGGSLTRRSRSHGQRGRRRLVFLYACHAAYNGHRCGNRVELQTEILDTAVLEALGRALDPDTIEAAVKEAVEQERVLRAGSADQRHALTREVALIDGRIGRLTEAVAAGGAAVGPLLEKLGHEQLRRQAVATELGKLGALDGAADFASAAVRRAMLRQASRVRQALLDHRDEARDVLAAFVPAITFTPFGAGRGRGYNFEATGTYGALAGETRRDDGVPDGIRTRVARLKIWSPRPA